jgi:hypothetical protein
MQVIPVTALRVSVLVSPFGPDKSRCLVSSGMNGMPRCAGALASLSEECHASVEPKLII